MILQIMGAFMAMFTFAVLLEIPKRYLRIAGFVAGFGWFIYLLGERAGFGAVISSFLSALIVTLAAHLLAKKKKTPVSIFLIAGIIPTVPGTGMYRIAYYMILGDSAMASHYFMETLKVAGAIALAIFIMDSMYKLFTRNKMNKSENKIAKQAL